MSIDHRRLGPEQKQSARDILRHTPFGYLAVADDPPYVVPINFAHIDEGGAQESGANESGGWGTILFHTGPGRKTRAIADDPHVCLAIVAEAEFEKGDLPCDDGYAYRSVLAEGVATLLTDDTERRRALRAIVNKYDPGATDKPFDEEVLAQTLVYSIAVKAVSFKQKPRPA
jgi:uncharacterized protein